MSNLLDFTKTDHSFCQLDFFGGERKNETNPFTNSMQVYIGTWPKDVFSLGRFINLTIIRVVCMLIRFFTGATIKDRCNWVMYKRSKHTSFAICCNISIISGKSGLDVGSRCQHFSSNSASFGWVFLGIIGRNPWNPLEKKYHHICISSLICLCMLV